jgi:Protein of unknown function (DUF5663)
VSETLDLERALVAETGLTTLSDETIRSLLAAASVELELRVGTRLASVMTDGQLDQFEGYIDQGDKAEALRFLEATLPEYREIVRSEVARMAGEIEARAPEIIRTLGSEARSD